MEDSQLSGKTDPTLLKWLNNIISSNLKTKFKMQTSTTCISISENSGMNTTGALTCSGLKPHLGHLVAVT